MTGKPELGLYSARMILDRLNYQLRMNGEEEIEGRQRSVVMSTLAMLHMEQEAQLEDALKGGQNDQVRVGLLRPVRPAGR